MAAIKGGFAGDIVPVWVDTFVRTKFPVSPQQHPFFKSVSYIHAIGTLNGCLPLLLADRIVAERVPHDKSAAKVADMPPTFRPRRSEGTRLGNLLEFRVFQGSFLVFPLLIEWFQPRNSSQMALPIPYGD